MQFFLSAVFIALLISVTPAQASRQPGGVVMACEIDGERQNFRFTRWVLYKDTAEWLNNRAAEKSARITMGDFVASFTFPATKDLAGRIIELDFRKLTGRVMHEGAANTNGAVETTSNTFTCKDITPGRK